MYYVSSKICGDLSRTRYVFANGKNRFQTDFAVTYSVFRTKIYCSLHRGAAYAARAFARAVLISRSVGCVFDSRARKRHKRALFAFRPQWSVFANHDFSIGPWSCFLFAKRCTSESAKRVGIYARDQYFRYERSGSPKEFLHMCNSTRKIGEIVLKMFLHNKKE